jgi:dCTP diphosphatase
MAAAPKSSDSSASTGHTASAAESQKPRQSATTTFEDINTLIWDHLVARDWHRGEARSYAISIALEANELLEHYQWSSTPVGTEEELAAELADIFIYCFEFAQTNNIDIAQAIRQKLKKASEKYPAGAFKGQSKTDMLDAWVTAKKHYKKKETL